MLIMMVRAASEFEQIGTTSPRSDISVGLS
jgi:hypothetical protein